MPLPHIHTSKETLPQRCTNVLGLYEIADEISDKVHKAGTELPQNTKLEKLKIRLGNYVHIDQKLSITGEAIQKWNNLRNQHNISLPISLEDELTLIFYIYIYHEEPEKKKQELQAIFSHLNITEIPSEILNACDLPPLKKQTSSDTNGSFGI